MTNKNGASSVAVRFGPDGKGNFHSYGNTRGQVRSRFVTGALLLAVFAFISTADTAFADGAGEPESFFLDIVAAEDTTPVPPSNPWRPEVDQKETEILARLLWSSPLTNETDKRRLCWLVFNRVDDERYGVFGASVESVVIRREFPFYDGKAYLSETNLRIASDELSRWTAERMGIPVDRPLPLGYVFAAFNGHSVAFFKEIGGGAF